MQRQRMEQLKEQYTGKYVVADASRPELARFRGMVGQVKTINFNGCALVQFEADNNRGWYDIALEFLTVVDKPEPKPVAKPAKAAVAKPVAKAEPA